MLSFDKSELKKFYIEASSPSGISIFRLQTALRELFSLNRSKQDLDEFRLKKAPWKKLSDEILPVSRYFKFREIESGSVRFPLNSTAPDCWYQTPDGIAAIGIEVTIAQGRERYNLAKELVQKGLGRGFIGVPDDAPQSKFDSAMSRNRVMFTTEQALSSVKNGVIRCLSRKSNPRFCGYTLIVEAHLNNIPRERWTAIYQELQNAASTSPFNEVFVIGDSESEWGFQIK